MALREVRRQCSGWHAYTEAPFVAVTKKIENLEVLQHQVTVQTTQQTTTTTTTTTTTNYKYLIHPGQFLFH